MNELNSQAAHMNGMFGASVAGGKGNAKLSGQRGGHSEVSPSLFEVDGNDLPGEVDHGEDVEVEDVPVDAHFDVLPTGALTAAGVVDQGVDLRRGISFRIFAYLNCKYQVNPKLTFERIPYLHWHKPREKVPYPSELFHDFLDASLVGSQLDHVHLKDEDVTTS